MSNEPRILSLTGTPHPQALVTGINPGTGILGFRWLDASGQPVDSGGSVARFTPLSPLPKDLPNDPDTYPKIADAVLVAAIENPPAPPVVVPEEVTRRQLLLALYGAGITRSQIAAMLAGNEPALIEYQEALTFRRDHPLIASLGGALQMESEQIDQLFLQAAAL